MMFDRNTRLKNKTLSERIVDTISDSARENNSNDKSGGPKIVDFDDDEYELPDIQPTAFRKRNAKMLSEQSAKYRGKVVSRNDLKYENNDSATSNEKNDSITSCLTSVEDASMMEYESSNDDYEIKDSRDGGKSEESSHDETESFGEEDDVGSDIIAPHLLKDTNKQVELKKGLCIQNQLNLWESQLQLRLHLQKLLNKANLLPTPEQLQKEQRENKLIADTATECSRNISKLLQKLLHLQRLLYGQFSEIETSLTDDIKKSYRLISANKTTVTSTKHIVEHIQQNFNQFRQYRNTVLLKWDDRTKLLTPGAGSKKRSMKEEYDILRKIENTLMSRQFLIEKSQKLKIDVNSANTIKPYIYDDTDFYHQQLRELIEYKANSTSTAEFTKQLIELQKLRQKMKKKVDTRASKGRRIRYMVHKKLINFMAPIDNSNWTEESTNELVKSLFA